MSSRPSLRSSSPIRRFGRRVLVALGVAVGVGLLALQDSSAAEPNSSAFRVIVNAKNPTGSVKREFLAEMFLKKVTRWQTGEAAAPVDLRPQAAPRSAFSVTILKRPVAAVRQYWTQRIFSGRDLPPPELESDEAVLRYVVTHPGAVGYVSGGANISGAKPLDVR